MGAKKFLMVIVGFTLFVVWGIDYYLRRKNQFKEPDEMMRCPYCRQMIPKLSIECMECRQPIPR